MMWRYLGRAYLSLQKLRIACEQRLIKMGFRYDGRSKTWVPVSEEAERIPEEVIGIFARHYSMLYDEEKRLLREIKVQLKKHPLWKWCERVRGLGPVACLMFLSYIDPYKAESAGKAKAYFGLVPYTKKKSGEKLRWNPEAKGRLWVITTNVIMQKDPYYYPLYLEKKQYYLETERKVFCQEHGRWETWKPFKEIIVNPQLCPHYSDCMKRLIGKARRLGRQPKNPPCRKHLDNMAKRWLAGILVSHAAELMREALGLPTTSFKAHKNYIPPKP